MEGELRFKVLVLRVDLRGVIGYSIFAAILLLQHKSWWQLAIYVPNSALHQPPTECMASLCRVLGTDAGYCEVIAQAADEQILRLAATNSVSTSNSHVNITADTRPGKRSRCMSAVTATWWAFAPKQLQSMVVEGLAV